MKVKFSSILKTLREEENLRQQDLAEKLGTTQRKVSYWEKGKYEPDLETLWKIADFFGISCDELIGRKDI